MSWAIPDHWCITSIGQITKDTEQRIPSENEQFTYIDIGSVNRDTKLIDTPQQLLGSKAPSRARKAVRTGDVLVSMTRPNLNAVAMVPPELDDQIASTGFEVLRANQIEPRWLQYLVRSAEFVEAMSDLVQGALYPAIRSKDVRQFDVPLAPFAEQKRIADKLDILFTRVDACRGRLDRLPTLLKRFRQSVLTAAMTGALTTNWRGQDDLSEAAEKTLGDIIKVSSGKFLPAKNMAADGTIPVYGGNGINGYHNESNVFEETLVVGRVGFYCGSVFMTPKRAWVTDNALIVRHDPKVVSRNFLFFALKAANLRENDSSTAQPVISGQKIYSLPVRVPSLEEQSEVVRRVETLFAVADRLDSRFANARKQIDRLTPALLAKAFRGELVPQDPNDEPAQALLDRIKAQHETSAPVKVTRGRKRVTS